jgi:hypothetical protein
MSAKSKKDFTPRTTARLLPGAVTITGSHSRPTRIGVTRPRRANCAARRPVGVATEAEARYRGPNPKPEPEPRHRNRGPPPKPNRAPETEARTRTRHRNRIALPKPKPPPNPNPLPKPNTPGRRGRRCLTSPPFVASRRHQRPARTLHRGPKPPSRARSIRVCRIARTVSGRGRHRRACPAL